MGQTSGASKEPGVQDGFQPIEPHGWKSDTPYENNVVNKLPQMRRRSTSASTVSTSADRAVELGLSLSAYTSSDSVLSATNVVNIPCRMRHAMSVSMDSSKRSDGVDFHQRAAELGIPLLYGDTENMAQRLVRAFEKGREGHRSSSPNDLSPVILLKAGIKGFGDLSTPPHAHARRKSSTSASQVLTTLRTLSAKMGCDIGGTLAKLVLMTERTENQASAFPLHFGKTGRMVPELESTILLGPPGGGVGSIAAYQLKFLCGETQALDYVMKKFKSVPQLPTKKMSVTGGGAHKFRDIFLEKLQLDFVPMKEMQSVVEGLRFVLQYQDAFSDSIFELNEDDERVTVLADEIDIDEFLLVNIGSGISVLKVTPESFTRVGGSACGGATYVGLLKLLCDTSFQEGLRLAEKGSGHNIDTLVSDIYGKEGSAALGLAPDLTAANFGKLGTKLGLKFDPPKKEDMSFACLQMVMQVASVLAAAFSSSLDISTVFFVGGFLSNNNIVEKRISKSMRSLKANAYFSRHCDFLGALGCLSLAIDEIEWDQSPTESDELSSSDSSRISSKEV